jgi:hypothetical protein
MLVEHRRTLEVDGHGTGRLNRSGSDRRRAELSDRLRQCGTG